MLQRSLGIVLILTLAIWAQNQPNVPAGLDNSKATAPDGDTYKPPKSVTPAPKAHPTETNVGRAPAAPRGGAPVGAIVGAAAAAGGVVALATWLHARGRPEARLLREGPKMPDQFNMSGFSIGGFAGANWPVVLDHVVPSGSQISVAVTIEGLAPFNYNIPGRGRRQLVIFRLPSYFPARPTAAVFTINATAGGPNGPRGYVRLFGIGAGERAVGSVAIDQLKFGPDTIHPKLKQRADYSFHAHTHFDSARAEFMKAVTAQGQIISKLEDHDDIKGVDRETTSTREWNGKKATPGEHLLQVRAWESDRAKANWVIAWSADQVLVEE